VQRKRAVSQPGDRWEREADRAAAAALAGTDAPLLSAVPSLPAPDGELQPGEAAFEADLGGLDGSGQALPSTVRSFFESRYRRDLSHVRVHSDSRAASLATRADAMAFTVGHHMVFGSAQWSPSTEAGRTLIAHELAHVIQQSGGALSTAPLFRQRCGHDGKGTNCGNPRGGALGTIPFPGYNLVIDKEIVKAGLPEMAPGVWLHQVVTPFPNEEKSGKESGRIDALRVRETSGSLTLDIAEIKARSDDGGGCALATVETKGYVKPLKGIASNLATISKAIKKRFPQTGFRPPKKKDPSAEVIGLLKEMDIPVGQSPWAEAWEFYNNLQWSWKVITNAYETVSIEPFSDGDTTKIYPAAKWPTECANNKLGVEELIFMVNGVGGISYGCRKRCDEDLDEEEREKLKEVEAARAKAAALAKLADAVGKLENDLERYRNGHQLQIDLIFQPDKVGAPSYVGFAGFVVNSLHNTLPPDMAIWDNVGISVRAAKRALAKQDLANAMANMVEGTQRMGAATAKYNKWLDGVEPGAAKMKRTIILSAAAAVALFVLPTVLAGIAESVPESAAVGTTAHAGYTAATTTETGIRIVADLEKLSEVQAAMEEAAEFEAAASDVGQALRTLVH
jgi:hypothetical protein